MFTISLTDKTKKDFKKQKKESVRKRAAKRWKSI